MKRVAFIFPGQGSQKVGMGQTFLEKDPTNNDLFEHADQILNFSLSKMIAEGPDSQLTKTSIAQPALLLVSTMIQQELLREGIEPSVVAGHSLGEYSALVAAGALSLDDALTLVHERGKLMEEADPAGDGSMAAVLGLKKETISEKLAKVDHIVDLANLNCPGQIVISGSKLGIEQVTPILKDAGAKRIIPLNVSGPFHSRLMKPAAESYRDILAEVNFSSLTVPIYSNVTAQKINEHSEIKELLIQQLYSPVRFEEIIEQLLQENLDAIVEVGSGKVLSGLVKRVSRRAKVFAVEDQRSFNKFVDWYQGGE